MYRMVRMYQTARKGMSWHLPIRVHPILDSFSSESKPEHESWMDLEFVPEYHWSELENSDEDIDPDEFEAMMHVQGDSEDEVEILEPPPIPVVDFVSDNEDEIKLLQGSPVSDIEPMLTSDDLEGDVGILGDRGKVIVAWGKKLGQQEERRARKK
jgi:hypothetical protein